jgi:hypothetical protein
MQQRMALARRLLRAGQPIIDVALATGFADQAHFSKAFSRFAACRPAATARSIFDKTPAGRPRIIGAVFISYGFVVMLAIATKGFLLSISLCLDIGIVNAALINTGLRKGCARLC